MKKLTWIIAMLALVVLIGCTKTETPQEKFQKEVSVKIEEIQKNVDKLKEAYDAKVAEMRKQFDEKMTTGKKSYDEAVANLKDKEAAAKKELADMKSATGDAWEKAKDKMQKTTAELEKAYENIKATLKE
jgi:hypothetical protein